MFERMLAKKYILAQKRHSALTVCSIVIAIALIVMLFTMFSTVMGIMRNIAYSEGDYHIMVVGIEHGANNIDKELCDTITEALSEYGTCTPEETFIDGKVYYNIKLMLNKSIDSANLFMNRIAAKTNVKDFYFYTNDMLIFCDLKDAKAGMNMSMIIALFYVVVLVLIIMLRLIIDTAFEISSKERERQFGVLQSIGATPKQIVRIMTHEGLMLSAVGIPLGTAVGIGLGYLVYRAVLGTGLMDLYLTPSRAAELVHFSVSPWLTLLGIVTGLVWVLLSAYGTGMRVIKMSPVQAISQRAGTVRKVHRASLFGKLFGWTGKLASRNNMRQPKRFIATVVSLTLSIAIFSAVTVVVNDLSGAIDDHYAERAGLPDITVYAPYYDNDPLAACKEFRKIEESGLFSEIHFNLSFYGGMKNTDPMSDKTFNGSIDLVFYNRDDYDLRFNGHPTISYDELTASGGYIISKDAADILGSEKSVTVSFSERTPILYSEEEYNALTPKEQEKFNGKQIINGVTSYTYYPEYTVDFDIYGTTDESYLHLTGTVDQYENGAYLLLERSRTTGLDDIYCLIAEDADYYEVINFLERNDMTYNDSTAENRRIHALLTSANIVAAFLSVLIALIAVVNMVNILATGILNRRAELAALQCVGMTEKELRKMTVIECLQYALTSGIAAVAVCELMMLLTEKMLHIVLGEEMQRLEVFINYAQPLPIIAAAALCAFAVALAASFTAQRTMKKTSLVEQIRSVE
ncbi:MAG: FtsX-like permease family protein [Oscillospiraceae bacterium]|nr:FtsX-like permease family protein [Oscillospiraceae bacterium]